MKKARGNFFAEIFYPLLILSVLMSWGCETFPKSGPPLSTPKSEASRTAPASPGISREGAPVPSPGKPAAAPAGQPPATAGPVPTTRQDSMSGPMAVTTSPAPSTLFNPSVPRDARTIQRRMSELGLYNGAIDGIWGKESKAALKTFKEKNGLKNPDQWDKETQALMFKGTGK